MKTIYEYLEKNPNNDWQVIQINEHEKCMLVLAPFKGSVDDVLSMTNLNHCTIYMVLPENCDIDGLTYIYHNDVKQIPMIGMINIMRYKLLSESYSYGVVHKIQ